MNTIFELQARLAELEQRAAAVNETTIRATIADAIASPVFQVRMAMAVKPVVGELANAICRASLGLSA